MRPPVSSEILLPLRRPRDKDLHGDTLSPEGVRFLLI